MRTSPRYLDLVSDDDTPISGDARISRGVVWLGIGQETRRTAPIREALPGRCARLACMGLAVVLEFMRFIHPPSLRGAVELAAEVGTLGGRHHRLVPGEGELALRELIANLPSESHLSIEVQSDSMARALCAQERADRCHAAAMALLTDCQR